jgi:hypothetical protein
LSVAEFMAAEEYAENALRELALHVGPFAGLAAQRAWEVLGTDEFEATRRRFCELASNADEFMPVRSEVAPHVRAAHAQSCSDVDVNARLPVVCQRTASELSALLDAAERLSRAGVLRTPPPAEAVSAFRRRYLAEIHCQLSAAETAAARHGCPGD